VSGTGERDSPSAVWLVGVALILAAFFLAPSVIRGYHFAIGADAPVYTWWARLAGHDGLSAVGSRPGVPALALVVGGTLNMSTTEAVGAIGVVLPVAVGLAAAGLVMCATWSNPATVVAALFAGWYSANLANGYLASLAAAALFLAGLAAVVRRRPVAGAILLGAAALCHLAFAALGAGVLLTVVAWEAWSGRRGQQPVLGPRGRAALGALAGGAGIAGVGFLALFASGAGPIPGADTSKDAFLRRAGLTDRLHELYRSRFAGNWVRYLLPVYVPLAAVGAVARWNDDDEDAPRFALRSMVAWIALTALGIVAALVTGLLPAERFLSFAFALPVLAALGVAWLWATARRHAWRRIVAGLAVAAVAIGSALAWRHAAQFFRDDDMAAAAGAARVIAALPTGTPVVFVVDEAGHAGLDVPRWANELRSAVPPDRIRDVHLFVGTPADYVAGRAARTGDAIRDRLSELYLADVRRALAGASVRPVAIVLRPMNEPGFAAAKAIGSPAGPGVVVIRGPAATATPAAPLTPAPIWRIVLAAFEALALIGLVGFGWTRGLVTRGPAALGLSLSMGIAALSLAGIAVDRLGVRLTGSAPLLISVAVGAGGYALWLGRGRRGVEDDVPAERRVLQR
jgi:hypothetical protein